MKYSVLLLASAAFAALSCNALMMPEEGRKGSITISFEDNSLPRTKSDFPDTNSFILTVKDSKGTLIYGGTYGAAPESILADPGTYTVSVQSREFGVPEFDTPVYGDTEIAVVSAGKESFVTLYCTQINCGIRLKISPDFLSACPDGVLFVKSSAGRLMYAYRERRYAFFQPGAVSVVLSENGGEKVLYTRSMAPQDMLSVGVSATTRPSGGTAIQIDTARNWLSDSIDVGGGGAGSTQDSAISVGEARDHVGETDVWVYGYIVGGDLSSSKCSFKAPFASRTNIVLASKSSCTDKASCVSVQLSKGDIRDALNLVDHPELLGRQVMLKGEIVASYYGITGVQNISEYSLR